MAFVRSRDLFASNGGGTIEAAPSWIASLLTGSLAVTLCVIAVALVGFFALNGSFRVRQAGRAVTGIFLLLGAGTIAAALSGFVEQAASDGPAEVYSQPIFVERNLPPADYDPYAGASLRRD